MNVRLPDGTIITNVPEGTTRSQLVNLLRSNGYDVSGLEGTVTPSPAVAPASTVKAEPQPTVAPPTRPQPTTLPADFQVPVEAPPSAIPQAEPSPVPQRPMAGTMAGFEDAFQPPQVEPTASAAPTTPAEPPPYKNRVEALDDAVNMIEEGADQKEVFAGFSALGIAPNEIVRHGQQRGSEFFQQEKVEPGAVLPTEPTGRMEAFEPSMLRQVADDFKRAKTSLSDQATSFLMQTGGISPEGAAQLIRRNARQRSAAAPNEAIQRGMEEIGSAETFGGAAQAMLNNPRATWAMLVDSVLVSSPALAATLVAAPVGVGARAATMFATSGGMEYASVMTDVLQDRGIDLTNANKVAEALKDPKIIDEMKEKGAKRGLIIGAFDALSMGLAGRFVRPANDLIDAGKLTGAAAKRATVAAWSKELALQMGAGAGGEFAAQQATGENKPAAVLLEALAEGVTAPVEVAGVLRDPRLGTPEQQIARAIETGVAESGFTPESIDAAARAALETEQSLAGRAQAEAAVEALRRPPPGRAEPTIGEMAVPTGRAEPTIGELPPSEGVEPTIGEIAPSGRAEPGFEAPPAPPAAPAGIGMPDVEEANIQTIQADEAEAARAGVAPAITTTPPDEAVTTEETKPAPAAVVDSAASEGIPVVYPLVSALKLSDDVPQFKEDADQKGVVNKLTGKFDWRDFGAIQVWQRLNGDLEVISGRHRLDLAQRSGIERVPAQIYREADGFTAQDAAILDAELNIRDEKGTVKDYVQYFKGSGITQEEAQSRGLLDNVKGTRAFAIANFGSPELVAAHGARQLSDEAAAQIALAAPQDSRLQAVGLKVRQDGKSDEAAVNAVRAVKAIAREQNTTTDMFGFDDSLIKEAVEMAKIAERKQKELANRIAVLSKVSKNPKIAEQEGIDIKDPKAVASRIQELKDLRAAWNNWETNPDLINEIRQERGAFELTAETEEQRAAREAEEEAARRAEAEAAAEAERKAKADRERGEFVLTGSDRPADELEARGQEALFGAEPTRPPNFFKETLPSMGFVRLERGSDRAYRNKSGEEFATYEKDGVRVAFSSNELLFEDDRGRVMVGMSEPTDLIFQYLGVDPDVRGQGKASSAIDDVIRAANQSKVTLYLEPASLEKNGLTTPQLIKFYKQYGFAPMKPGSDKVLVGHPQGAVVETNRLPNNMEARVVKTSDGYASLLFDKDSNNVVNGSVTRFTGEDALSRATTSFNELAAKATPTKPITAPEAIEEVVEPVVEQAPVAQNLAEAQATYDKALEALNAHGSAPPKPSSEKKYFGKLGREFFPPEEVAKYDAQVKAYDAWRRKYNKLKKAEVDAANNLERARQADRDAKNGAASPDQASNESQAIETTVKGQLDSMANDFMVGDQVRFGNTPGVVIGLEGDYVRFRPDAAKSPKAYQRVPKASMAFVSRPDTTSVVSYSKEQDNKFGDEAGALNADKSGLIQLLGANMYQSALADVAIKELLQNAFDAVKGAASTVNSQGNKITPLYKEGKIDVEIDSDNRTITIRDNARGMTPDIVRNAFFTIAGSDKSDLPPELRSGGFGFAKMGFMLGSESLKLDTVRDGVRVTVDTTAKDIASDNFTIKKSPAPKGEHGTSITVKIPDKYIDRNGEAKDIYFPYSLGYIEPLNRPLIGPVEVTATLTSFGDKETKVLPIGVNFPKDKFTKFKANFDWGSADIYFSIDRNPGKKWEIKHQVLSSGVYQFDPEFVLNNEKIPYDIIVDVKPNVTARDPNYPFENSRERFKGRLKKDIDALTMYLGQIARGYEARDLQESFKGIVSMPRIEAGAEIAGAAEKLKKSFGAQGAAQPVELKPLPKEVTVTADAVQDTATRQILVDVKTKEAEKQKEATFKAEQAPKALDFMLEMKQDPKLPVFHNNTNVDFVEIGREYGEPEKFFAELGTLMVEMKEDLAKSGLYGYDKLSPDNLFFAGVSVDKQYGGVHIRVPYKAVFVNPFYDWGAKTLFGVRQNLLNTMIHEIAHTGSMDHGVAHNGQMIKVEQYLADEGLLDYYRDALLDVLRRHESTFTAMREAYGKSTTRNTAKSLEDYGKDAAAASARGDRDGGKDQAGAVPAGGRPGRGKGVPGAAAARAEEEPARTGEDRQQQVDALLEEFDRPDVPSRDTKAGLRTLIPSATRLKELYRGARDADGRAADSLTGQIHRGIAYARNKLFFSGAGLEEADARRYGRQVVTDHDQATATLALDNMLHGGGIAVEFLTRGGIEFNPKTKRIQAVEAQGNMMDVYRAEKSLKDELGVERAEKLINGYLEAKRSRSIKDEIESLTEEIETASEKFQDAYDDLQKLLTNPASTKQAINAQTKQVDQMRAEIEGMKTQLEDITRINEEKVLMDDAEIDAFIGQENDFPQLRQIMDNWTAQNHRLLGLMRSVRLISDKRYERLMGIKDYVPWQRVQDDDGDIHGPAPSRSVTRIPKEPKFKKGKTERPVEYIIDNMTDNLLRLTMNSLRQYAAGRIVSEYATRNEKGQIKTFPKEDRDKNRFPYIVDGRRTIVEIKDPLIAEAVYGRDSIDIRMNEALEAATNFVRRAITIDPFFQMAQVIKDAPTAAIVTGVKNPAALMGRVMTSFAGSILNTDPVADILRANGIGGFQSIARTPEKRLKQKIGIATMSVPQATLALLDHIGDASDFAARMAAYKQTMADTGDESLALYRAANVINFNRLGSSPAILWFVRYVNFANAYLQSIDTLVTALSGKGMRGQDTKAALAQVAKTLGLLTSATLLYSFLVGGDDEYQKLDDDTKARNFFIPKSITKELGLENGILIPMNTTASFMFKAFPELTYQYFVSQGTKTPADATRYWKSVRSSLADAMFGPEPVPSAVRPIVEIAMDRSFFTEKSLTPRGMETLEKSRQFTDATSELGKQLGQLGGLSPIEWDHLIRGTTGVAGMMAQYGSNMIGEYLDTRPESTAKQLPFVGRFVAPEVGRGREALFYDLHERVRRATSTYKDLAKNQPEKAAEYLKENRQLIGLSEWSNKTEADLKEINGEIRRLSRSTQAGTAEERRARITQLQNQKSEALSRIEEIRKRYGEL